MKKILFYIPFLILLFCIGCPPVPGKYPVKRIVYKAINRGQSEMIDVTSNVLTYKASRKEEKKIALNAKSLRALHKLIKKIEFKQVGALKAPSNKRSYDGAMSTTITFSTESETYRSSIFDDDNPPNELRELVALLKSFVQ